ncbi:unnamed protein product [Vicia faba]|uniref:Uncharacterized protein n=1 Tax=Vicia faba TaxID=3906 RepID=A0AAV0YF58_VICFA|nr:unnamed protein product [Vicia faba]
MELIDRKPLFLGKDHMHQLGLLMELIGADLGFLKENAKRYIRKLLLYHIVLPLGRPLHSDEETTMFHHRSLPSPSFLHELLSRSSPVMSPKTPSQTTANLTHRRSWVCLILSSFFIFFIITIYSLFDFSGDVKS